MLSHPAGSTEPIAQLVAASGGSRDAVAAALRLDAPDGSSAPPERATAFATQAAAIRNSLQGPATPLPAIAATTDPEVLLVAVCALLIDAEAIDPTNGADVTQLGHMAVAAQAIAVRAVALGMPGIVNRLAHRTIAAVDDTARRLGTDAETVHDAFMIEACLEPRHPLFAEGAGRAS